MRTSIALVATAFAALCVAHEHAPATWWERLQGKGYGPKHGEHHPGKYGGHHTAIKGPPHYYGQPMDDYESFHAYEGHHEPIDTEFVDPENEFFDAGEDDLEERDAFGPPNFAPYHHLGHRPLPGQRHRHHFARGVSVDPSEAENSEDQTYYDSGDDGDDAFLARTVTKPDTDYPDDDSGEISDEEFDHILAARDLEDEDAEGFPYDEEEYYDLEDEPEPDEDEDEEFGLGDDGDSDLEELDGHIEARGAPQRIKDCTDFKNYG